MVKRSWQRLKDWLWLKSHKICTTHLEKEEWIPASSFNKIDGGYREYGKMLCAKCFKKWAEKTGADNRTLEIRRRRGFEW